jgi:hypothetical protein
MIRRIGAPHRFNSSDSLRSIVSLTVPGAGILAFSFLAGALMLRLDRVAAPNLAETSAAASAPTTDASNPFGALLVGLRSRSAPASIAQSFPPEWSLPSMSSVASAAIPDPENARPTPMPAVSRIGEGAPLPPPRPAEFASAASRSPPQVPARRLAELNKKTALLTTSPDNRTFFETFFGVAQPSNPATSGSVLAYAAPESGLLDNARKILSGPLLRYDRWTAVYDISAHTVYLPNGTRLEAHSGLGARMDDPRYVHERMRGATPPNVYELSPRERLFHGVQALRLEPVGEGGVYGRSGLLAHSYMLGPKGDSNGCVVFKNYGAFLQAFQNGEVKRLAVVARLD